MSSSWFTLFNNFACARWLKKSKKSSRKQSLLKVNLMSRRACRSKLWMHGYICDCKRGHTNLLIPKEMGKDEKKTYLPYSRSTFASTRECLVLS